VLDLIRSKCSLFVHGSIRTERKNDSDRRRRNVNALAKNLRWIWHSEDRASWYIHIIKANDFSNSFWCRTLHVSDRFAVHQESSTVYTAIGICHTGYADCLRNSASRWFLLLRTFGEIKIGGWVCPRADLDKVIRTISVWVLTLDIQPGSVTLPNLACYINEWQARRAAGVALTIRVCNCWQVKRKVATLITSRDEAASDFWYLAQAALWLPLLCST
jgi:hypothetical protein